MTRLLSLNCVEHVATVSMLTPTMPPSFFSELRELFVDIAKRPEMRAVVLQSKAKGFGYGLDLPATFKEHAALFSGGGASQRTALLALIRDWQDCMESVVRCPIPVIAAIHGPCIGGAIDLITACDIRLASSDSTFSVRETRIAIVADLGTLQRLPAIVGQGHARELALTGCDIDAQRAAAIGLVNRVFADASDVRNAAAQMAADIASNPPLTVRGVKDVLNFGMEHGARAGLSYVGAWNSAFLASEDLAESMTAFMAKRPAKYQGK